MGNGIALTDLLAVIVIENKQAITALKEFQAIKDKALASGDKSTLQADFDKLATTLKETNRAFEPLLQTTKLLAQQQQSLSTAVKAGVAPAAQAVKAYRDLEAAYKSQLTTLQKGTDEYKNVTAQMKAAGSEAQRLEGLVKGANAAYKADDLGRYSKGLQDIVTSQKAGISSQTQAIAQLKSYQSALAQQTGALKEGSAEYKTVVKVMGDTGTAIRKLTADTEKVDKAFRADTLKVYSGELKQIDANIKGLGFDRAAQEVDDVTRRLKEQATALSTNGREFDALSRVLQTAATQQERYQKAAQDAARVNNAAEIRAYVGELNKLEGELQNATVAYGRLDSQQRALKYDSAGVRDYRTQTEGLQGTLEQTGRGLDTLATRIKDYAQNANLGARESDALARVMKDTEAAAVKLAQAQDKTAQSFRNAELGRFTTELKAIETAQKAGATSADQAASAVARLQGEFRDYAAGLGVTERELGLLVTGQRDAATTAGTLATAQERALRAFDSAALRSFAGELQTLVREQRDGGTAFDDTARRVTDLQGRLREYGATLRDGSGEQAALNRVLELSDRALTDVGTAAERAQRGFEGSQVRDFATELDRVGSATDGLAGDLNSIEGELSGLSGEFKSSGDAARISADEYGRVGDASRELNTSLNGIEGELSQLVGSLKETGNQAGLSAQDLNRLADVETQLIGTTERLQAAQDRANGAYHTEFIRQQVAALNDLKLALEKGRISQEDFVTSAKQIDAALTQARGGLEANTRSYAGYTGALTKVESSLAQAEGRVQRFGISAGVTAGIGDQLQNVLYRLGPAGEAMGVAMFSAGAGMEGAAVGARALNIALAVGLVGAIVAIGYGAVQLVKNMFALDTGLTDVAKTTGFAGDELTNLAKRLQDIALATGTPVQELTDLAAVAGSLGITGVDNVAKFTDVINKLAVATDIVGRDGAESLAKFINVTKDAGQSVGDSAELVGNVIVRLGNSLATTEAPILAMAQRLATLKASANVSQTDILGLSGGFVSLGLTAERAEVSVSKLFTDITKAASSGGPALKTFATAAGLTVEQFQALAKESPTEAFLAVVEGLKKAKEAGQDLNPILDAITGKNTTQRNVLLTLVGGYDTLTKSMQLSRDETEKMTALNAELDTRLSSLRGTTDLIGQSFRYAFDSLALSAIPALKNTLTGVLDFTRGILGLEQTGDRVQSFASKIGTAIGTVGSVTTSAFGEYAAALYKGQNDTDSFAAKTGITFRSIAGIAVESVKIIAGGVAPIIQSAFTNVSSFLSTAVQNIAGSGTAIGTIFTNIGQVVQNAVQFIGGVLGRIPAYYQAVVASSNVLSGAVNAVFTGMAEILLGVGYIVYGAVVQPFVDMVAPIQQAAGNVLQTVQNWVRGLGDFFAPVINLAKSVGVAIGDFFGKSAEVTRAGINDVVTKGVETFKAGVTQFNSNNEQIQKGTEKFATGYNRASTAVVIAQGALKGSLDLTQKTLEASVDDADGLKTANEALGQSSVNAAANVSVLGTESGEATGSVADLGEVSGETGRTVSEMADNIAAAFERGDISARTAIDSLNTKLAELKQQKADALASGDYDPADIQAFDRDIVALQSRLEEAKTAAENFRDGVTSYDEAQREANKSIQAVSTIFDQQRVLIERLNWDGAAQNVNLYADAQDAAEAAIRANTDAAFAQEDAQRTLNKTIADGLTVFSQQDAVLKQLGLAIATDSTNNLAAAQAALTMATREAGNAVLLAKDANRQMGEQSSLTATQTALITKSQLDVNAALQEAQNAFTITGDAAKFNADKTEIYKAALETLYKNGIDPAKVGLQGWVTALQESNSAIKTAAEGAKKYEENLKSVSDVQEAFADGISASEIDGYIESLRKAALETGTLGQKAKDLIKDLEGLKQTYQGLDALSSVFSNIAATFDTTGAQSQLDALNQKKEELLQSGDYDGADFKQLQSDIENLENSISNTQLLEGLFEGVAEGAAAVGAALEEGLGAGEQALAGLAAGLGALGGAISETDSLMGNFLQNASGAIQSLVGGDFLGFVGGVFNTIVGIFKSHSDEVAQYETIVRENGEEVAKQFSEMTANGIQVNEVAYEEWKHNEEVRGEQHKKFLEEWVEREKKRNEEIAAANRELAKLSADARDALNELNTNTDDARIKFYESTHSGKKAEGQSFIAQTILDFRAESLEFNQEMGRITQEKNEYINTYLAANPGAGRAEANAAAEKIFGPQREALKEQFALTGATILNDAAKQAKDLGLSQSKFYEAVFAGNNEILGDMTEGQRQSIIQFVTVAHEMGIELPKALEDAYNKVDQQWQNAGEQQNKQAELAQAQVDRLKEQYKAEQDTFKEESNKLQVLIKESKGAEREEYQKQLALLTEEHTKANAEYEGKIREANAALAKAEEEGGAELANANQTKIDALKNADVEYARVYEERAATLKRLIESSTGEQKAIYEEQLRIETQAYEEASRKRSDEIQRLTEEGTQVTVAELEKQRETLKSEYEKASGEIAKALETATGAERDALLKRQSELHDAYISSDLALVDTINESQDGVGSAIAEQAQATVSMIEEDISTLNSAWAKRSAELQGFIATSTGATKTAYEEQYRQESAAYEQTRQDLQNDLTSANQGLLDAQDKGSSDFIAAQEEIGRKESEALGGIYEQLRALLGPEADLIISMIQSTYDKRRAAYLQNGQASADAAAQANQGELDTLAGIFEQLRALLGPDADVIISMIQGTYDKRTAAYNTGGSAAANAAEASAESERQSVANVNQVLRDLFGPEAQGIIDQILALYQKREDAYNSGGAATSAAATAAGESERQSVANINQLLRDLFGPEAQGIIDQILALYDKKQEAYKSGGEGTAAAASDSAAAETDAVNQGTDETTGAINDNADQTTGALADRSATIESFLARGDVTPQLRTSLEAFNAAIADGGNLSAQEIDAARDKVTTALNDRGEKIRALVADGVPLADAIRQVDLEFARTVDETSAEISRSASEGGTLAAQGIAKGQDVQVAAIEALKSGLLTGVGGLSGQVTPQISEEHRKLMDAFIEGARTSGGGIDAAESAQIQAMQAYQAQLDSSVSGIGGNVAPVVTAAHSLIGGAFTTGGGLVKTDVAGALGLITGGIGDYTGVSPLVSSVFGGISSTVTTQGSAVAGDFTRQGSAIETASRSALVAVSGTFSSEGGKLSSTVQSVFNTLTGAQNSGASGFTSTLGSTFGNVNRAIDSGYTLTTQGYRDGGNSSAAAIQAAYNLEEARFKSESAALQSAIQNAKGSEKAKLTAEYNALQNEHAAKSRAYQSAISQASSQEKGAVGAAENLLSGALGAFSSQGQNATQSAYSGLNSSWKRESGKYISAVGGVKTDMQRALEAVASVIKNFKFPALPAPPKVPSIPGAGRSASGDAGINPRITPVSFDAPSIGAYAADALPDYSVATTGVQAYAAATGSLLDLFGDSRALTLSSTQQRDLNLTVSFSGFKDVFTAPAGIFDSAANTFSRATNLYAATVEKFDRIVDRFGSKAGMSTFELARKPLRRRGG